MVAEARTSPMTRASARSPARDAADGGAQRRRHAVARRRADRPARLLGSRGDGSYLRPPIYCDYGSNIRVGSGTFANFGLMALDVAPITIGDDVQIGPNVQLSRRRTRSNRSRGARSGRAPSRSSSATTSGSAGGDRAAGRDRRREHHHRRGGGGLARRPAERGRRRQPGPGGAHPLTARARRGRPRTPAIRGVRVGVARRDRRTPFGRRRGSRPVPARRPNPSGHRSPRRSVLPGTDSLGGPGLDRPRHRPPRAAASGARPAGDPLARIGPPAPQPRHDKRGVRGMGRGGAHKVVTQPGIAC